VWSFRSSGRTLLSTSKIDIYVPGNSEKELRANCVSAVGKRVEVEGKMSNVKGLLPKTHSAH